MSSEAEVEVRLEDQLQINEFGRVVTRLSELKEDLASAKRAHENLTDATDEVALAGDEEGAIKLLIGEAFMTMEEDAATEFLERLAEEKKERIAAMEAEAATLEERKKELKRVLYGRFGASINLEE